MCRCFNPHPAFLPGDARLSCGTEADALSVSIRTRHFCRVMLNRSWAAILATVFQSAPGISAG